MEESLAIIVVRTGWAPTELSTIKIIDVVGKEIYRMKISGQINAVDLSTFDNGSYFFNILDASGKTLISDKLLKVK